MTNKAAYIFENNMQYAIIDLIFILSEKLNLLVLVNIYVLAARRE